MPVLSALRASTASGLRTVLKNAKGPPHLIVPVRHSCPARITVRTGSYQWNKVKDEMHFYIMLGVIPLGAVILYANVFIGPAELQDIPEGYVPYDYEYVKHPISRWLQKNIFPSYEKTYERSLYFLHKQDEKRKARQLSDKVKALSRQNQDEENWYFVPVHLPIHDSEARYKRTRFERFNP